MGAGAAGTGIALRPKRRRKWLLSGLLWALCGGKLGADDHDPLDGPADGRVSFSCANMVPCPRRLSHGVQARARGLVLGKLQAVSPFHFRSLTPGPPPFSGRNSTPAASRAALPAADLAAAMAI